VGSGCSGLPWAAGGWSRLTGPGCHVCRLHFLCAHKSSFSSCSCALSRCNPEISLHSSASSAHSSSWRRSTWRCSLPSVHIASTLTPEIRRGLLSGTWSIPPLYLCAPCELRRNLSAPTHAWLCTAGGVLRGLCRAENCLRHLLLRLLHHAPRARFARAVPSARLAAGCHAAGALSPGIPSVPEPLLARPARAPPWGDPNSFRTPAPRRDDLPSCVRRTARPHARAGAGCAAASRCRSGSSATSRRSSAARSRSSSSIPASASSTRFIPARPAPPQLPPRLPPLPPLLPLLPLPLERSLSAALQLARAPWTHLLPAPKRRGPGPCARGAGPTVVSRAQLVIEKYQLLAADKTELAAMKLSEESLSCRAQWEAQDGIDTDRVDTFSDQVISPRTNWTRLVPPPVVTGHVTPHPRPSPIRSSRALPHPDGFSGVHAPWRARRWPCT
jgi:hypothetical protein